MISVGARRLPGSRPRNLCVWLLARLHSSRAIGLADGVATTRARWRVGRARSSPLPRRPDVSRSVPAAIRTTCAVCTSILPYTNTTAVELWCVPACRRRLPLLRRVSGSTPGTRAPRHAARRVAAHAASAAVACRGRERSERGLRGPPRAPWPVRVSALASRGVSLARFGHRTRLTLSGVGPLRGLALPGPAGGFGGGFSGFVSEISPFHFHM